MLFSQSQITGLFGFENRKEIFEGVHRSFKFVVLTFERGKTTTQFPAAFMRHEVQELDHFPDSIGLWIDVELIRKLAPDSLSVMEFKSDLDVRIVGKMLKFPPLSQYIPNRWNPKLHREFHMTDDAQMFHKEPKPGRLPLFTGKMFYQYEPTQEHSGYWIDEKEGRQALLRGEKDSGQQMDYQGYRWLHRRIASNTNERTFITYVTPPMVFTEMNSTTLDIIASQISNAEMLFFCAVCNSFTVDWLLRQKVTTTLNMFYIYQLPIPRYSNGDPCFGELVSRSARLICTKSEFDDLAKEVGLGSHKNGVTDEVARAKLRAEIDGMVAHLYGLTEAEFTHILSTFPLVPEPVKVAAQNAYRDVERGLIK
jgi:hypothetical protein